jgi:hypothetical protein
MSAALLTSDARGYRQWQEVGRQVKKGEKSLPILVPIVRKRTTENRETDQEEETSYLAGFTSAPAGSIDVSPLAAILTSRCSYVRSRGREFNSPPLHFVSAWMTTS